MILQHSFLEFIRRQSRHACALWLKSTKAVGGSQPDWLFSTDNVAGWILPHRRRPHYTIPIEVLRFPPVAWQAVCEKRATGAMLLKQN